MDKQFLRDSAKNRRVFQVMLACSVLAYLLLLAGLVRGLLAGREATSSFTVKSASLIQGNGDRDGMIRITGSGFDETVRASLSYDGRKHGAVVGSLKTWSYLNQVVVRGDKAFLANQARGVQVLDVSNPKRPKIIGSVDTPGMALGVCVDGDYVYVADGSSGLKVLSVADPTRPRIIGGVGTRGPALAVKNLGGVVFVAEKGGISAIAVDPQEQPRVLHALSLDNPGEDLAVKDRRIFLANGKGGVAVFQYDLRSGFRLLQTLKTSGDAKHLFANENWLLVGCGKGVDVFGFNGANPELLAAVDTPGFARGVAASGNRIFVADNNFGLRILECGPRGGFKNIKTIDTLSTACDVFPANGLLFVADGSGGLQVVDEAFPSDSVDPVLETGGFVWGMASHGNRLYLANGLAGVKIIDIAGNGELRIAAVVDTPGYARRLEVSEGRLYVADSTGLVLVDDRGKNDWRIRSVLPLPGSGKAMGLALKDNLAYLAAGTAGLVVADVTDPDRPRVLSQLAGPENVMDVALAGDRAYLACKIQGLLEVSVKDPERPVLLGKIELPRHLQLFAKTTGVSVAGDRLLVANGRAGCQVFDIENPEQPRFVTSFSTMGNVTWVKGVGDRAYFIDHDAGLQVVDLRAPCIIGNLGARKAMEIAVAGKEAYVSLGGGGVKRLPLPVEVQPFAVTGSRELLLPVPPLPLSGNYRLTLFKNGEYAVMDGTIPVTAAEM